MAEARRYIRNSSIQGVSVIPYIDQEQREVFDVHMTTVALNLVNLFDANPGVINYILTKFFKEIVKAKGETYQTYNDILGAIEGAKLELYRRDIAIYENRKINENGEVK